MATERPVWFTDWRALWWNECRSLGMWVSDDFARHGRLVMTRDVWKKIRRCQRLYCRLEAEVEAKDHTFGRELLRMVTKWQSDR